jgi:urease accessory protein
MVVGPVGAVSVAGLLLGDSRFPAGGHAHSGGVEPAVTAGTVTDMRSLELFLRGRLRTVGLVAAGVAAAACAYALGQARDAEAEQAAHDGTPRGQAETGGQTEVRVAAPAARVETGGRGELADTVNGDGFWSLLDAETDARTPAPAQREASRRQGRALLRAARVAWPEAIGLAELAAAVKANGALAHGRPGAAGSLGANGAPGAVGISGVGVRLEYRGGAHHAVVLGAAAAAAGCDAGEAARIAAYQAVAGAVSAAVRLLALDPMRATGVLARLTADIDEIAARGASFARRPVSELPCPSAPALDLLAEAHMRAEVRLFES